MRRTLTVLAASALVAGGGVPAVAKAKPKARPIPPCLALADPRGDATVDGHAATNDPALDLTSVRFPSVPGSFAVTYTVAQWAERPQLAVGSRFQVAFNVGGDTVDVFYKSGPARAQESELFYQQGVRLNGIIVTDEVTAVRDGNALTVSVRLANLSNGISRKVDGVAVSGVVATSFASYVGTNTTRDTATTKTPLVIGRACR